MSYRGLGHEPTGFPPLLSPNVHQQRHTASSCQRSARVDPDSDTRLPQRANDRMDSEIPRQAAPVSESRPLNPKPNNPLILHRSWTHRGTADIRTSQRNDGQNHHAGQLRNSIQNITQVDLGSSGMAVGFNDECEDHGRRAATK